MALPFHLFNLVSWLLPARCHGIRCRLLRWCGAKVGANVCLNSNVLVYGSHVEIGHDTWVSSETTFSTGPKGTVRIGCCCDIGPGVKMISGSHVLGGPHRRAGAGFSQPIVIGDGCWVGACSVILGGVTLGDGCVVGAGALVLAGNYPPNVLLAGVPAKIKKELSPE